MKKILILVIGIFIMLGLIETASAQNRMFKKKKPVPSMRGKANARELGKEVFEALQTGNTTRLVAFAPSNDELKKLTKEGAAETAAIVKTTDAAKLEQNWAQDLEILKSQLAAENMSPATATLAAVQASRPNAKTPEIVPVTVKITNAKQDTVAIRFEALRHEKRLLLFRNLTLEKEMQAAITDK